MEVNINCAEACVNGCVLGDRCPNLQHREAASKFIDDTPLDKMLEIAEESVRKKLLQPPQWVLPEEP